MKNMTIGSGKRLLWVALAMLVSTLAVAQQDHAGHGDAEQESRGQHGQQDTAMQHGGTNGGMQHGGTDGGMQHSGSGGGMQQGGSGNGMQHGGSGGGMQRMMRRLSAQLDSASEDQGATVFATIQRVVKQLQADPDTDWSQVNISALHQHLVDMELLSLHAEASTRELDLGAEFAVTGTGRTLQAIQRMVPTHATQIASELGWQVSAELSDHGARVRVESDQPGDAAMIQALGFMGFMVLGDHHQDHHLGMAGAASADSEAAMSHGQHGSGGHQDQ